jgi:two-component system OmpR family response regulator
MAWTCRSDESFDRIEPRWSGHVRELSTMKLLLIEDDQRMADSLRRSLVECGHVVDIARDGNEGLDFALGAEYDVIITDRMLPGRDGIKIVKMLRSDGNRTPILMLTALAKSAQKVEGLDAGADDYLQKPFEFSELRARIDALARRPVATVQTSSTLKVDGVEMDLIARQVRRDGRLVELLPTEFRLLEYLMRHPRQVVTRTMLLERVWDLNFHPETNIVDVQISRLRRKLGQDGSDDTIIRTIRGMGYIFGRSE